MVERKFISNELFSSSSNRVGLQFLTETHVRSGALDGFVPRRRSSYVAQVGEGGPAASTLLGIDGRGREKASSRGRQP